MMATEDTEGTEKLSVESRIRSRCYEHWQNQSKFTP